MWNYYVDYVVFLQILLLCISSLCRVFIDEEGKKEWREHSKSTNLSNKIKAYSWEKNDDDDVDDVSWCMFPIIRNNL
jgi:hypothetical protein